jgi:hypothetical protein
LSRLQKAAVVHRMLGSLGMPLPPGTLSPEEEAQLAGALGTLDGVAPEELAAVIDEFLQALSPSEGRRAAAAAAPRAAVAAHHRAARPPARWRRHGRDRYRA